MPLRTLLAPATSLLLAAGLASAQIPPPAEPPDAASGTADPAAEEERPAEPSPRATLEDRIVVTADRIESSPDVTGSAVTVIGRDEIELRNEPFALDLLRAVPGVEVTQNGGPGTVASVFIRGGGSFHTLILIDGVRINSAASGGFDLSLLATDDIERIEVLRGPQSTLYGSEAMGGVVHILTRRGEGEPHGSAELEAGSHGTRRLAAQLDGARGAFDYAVAAADFETDGVSAASERAGNREDDPFESLDLSSRLGWAYSEGGRVELAARASDGDTALDGFAFGVGPVDDLDFAQDRELLQTTLQLTHELHPRWSQSARLAVTRDRLSGSDPTTPFQNFKIESRLEEGELEATVKLPGGHTLIAGYDFERRQAENRGSYDESLTVRSVFLQDRWSFSDRLVVTAGARHDDFSGFGDETTYRATGAFLWPRRELRLHGSLGTGFRVPGLDELFFPFVGNPELAPESSEGYDLGLEKTFGGGEVVVDLTYFDNRFEDLIQFDLGTFTFGNVARAESSGVEASLRLSPIPAVALSASYTYNDTEDLASGRALPRRPRQRGSLVVAFEATPRLRGAASLSVVRERIDSDGSPMDDYERLDLSLEYRAGRRLAPYLRIHNLLDEDYEEINGFTTPGRTLLAGLRLKL